MHFCLRPGRFFSSSALPFGWLESALHVDLILQQSETHSLFYPFSLYCNFYVLSLSVSLFYLLVEARYLFSLLLWSLDDYKRLTYTFIFCPLDGGRESLLNWIELNHLTLNDFKQEHCLLNLHQLFFIQIEGVQFVRDQLCFSGLSSEVQLLPSERAAPEWEQPAGFRSEASLCWTGESKLSTGDSEVSSCASVYL